MALGTIVLGPDAVLEVATAVGGPYSPISEISVASKKDNRPLDKFFRFMGATHVIPGARDLQIDLDGFVSWADDGQGALRTASDTAVLIYVKILPDGINGRIYPVRVGARDWQADAKGGIDTCKFTLGVDGDPTGVGDGGDF